jgi:hypothetical protein
MIALITVCADGGANRFFEWTKSKGRENDDVRCLFHLRIYSNPL